MTAIQTKHLQDIIQNHGQDMTNKVVAITGTTSGTGFVCARELAKKGATVILLNRKSERANSALEQLRQAVPQASFDAIDCDLQNLASVKEAIASIKSKYDANVPWEKTRDGLYERYQVEQADGYDMTSKELYCNGCFAAGINFGSSIISLLYGEGDIKETIKIGALSGWDSDNPTATWGGLLGFMIGKDGIEKISPQASGNKFLLLRASQGYETIHILSQVANRQGDTFHSAGCLIDPAVMPFIMVALNMAYQPFSKLQKKSMDTSTGLISRFSLSQ